MEYVYRTQGTCSTNIELEVENNIVKEVAFWGGCNGNLQGISRLVTGMPVSDVITKLEGIYNYKSKVKRMSTLDSNIFEEEVKKLGSLSQK